MFKVRTTAFISYAMFKRLYSKSFKLGFSTTFSFQSLSHVRLFAIPWTAARQASLSITNSRSSLRLTFESVIPSNHLILCCPLLFLPSIFPSIGVFSDKSVLCIRWPKCWSFSFNINPSGLISFRMDWLDLLAVQGTSKSLLQHHSSKASILWHSAFFQRKQWQPTPVLLPGKSHGRRSLVGCSPWGCEESDTTERLK